MARPTKNQATMAGTRRSETRRPPKYTHPYAHIPPDQRQRYIEEDRREQFKGYHTVIVTKTNSADPRAASNVNEYLGMGYKVLSDKPEDTGHGDSVLMGIPIDTWLQREEERVEDGTAALRSLIDGTAEAFENMQPGVKFDPDNSGVSFGSTIPVVGQAGPDNED